MVRSNPLPGPAPAVIVAVWGVESGFGTASGEFDTIRSLATLALAGERSAYFRAELVAALRILDGGDIARAALKGSWAGATGQTQFMPSSYLRHAADGDGDGVRDIWTSVPDVLASVANFLAGSATSATAASGVGSACPARETAPCRRRGAAGSSCRLGSPGRPSS